MNISIIPSFKSSIQFSKNNQQKRHSTTTTASQPTPSQPTAPLSFGSTQLLARDVINVYAPLSIQKSIKPVVELKPTKESIVGYLNSIYDKTSGYVVQNYESRVAELSKNIDDETVGFAHKLVSMVKKRPSNTNLSVKLNNIESITSVYKNAPEKRVVLDSILKQYDSLQNNAAGILNELATIAKS